MANTNGLITLDHVLKSFLNEHNETDLGNYNRYKQLLVEGYTDMNIHYTSYVDEYVGQVNAVNQMALPASFIDYVSVNVEVLGEYWPLTINEHLIAAQADGIGSVVAFPDHFNPPALRGTGYTTRARNLLGECRVDKENRIIAFKGNFVGKKIYLVFTSSGVPETGNVYVGRELLPVLKAYVKWRIMEADTSVALAVKMRAEYLYGMELDKLSVLENSMTMNDILDAIRAGHSQGLKR